MSFVTIGQTTILNKKENCQVTVDLIKEKTPDETIYKLIYKDENLGDVSFKKRTVQVLNSLNQNIDEICNSFGKVKIAFQSENYPFYGPHESKLICDKIYIIFIHSDDKSYKGIGTRLLQAIVEKSFRKLDGKVDLHASEAFEFYYKNQFRSIHQDVNEALEKEYIAAQKENRPMKLQDFSSNQMYLTDEGKKKWEEIVQKDPILFKPMTNNLSPYKKSAQE